MLYQHTLAQSEESLKKCDKDFLESLQTLVIHSLRRTPDAKGVYQ